MKTYFISIKSYNLAHYLSRALICSVKYLEERNTDIQDINSEFITLSTRKFINDSNCSIEVYITPEEEKTKSKQLSDVCLIFDSPLPISRVRHIWFTEEDQKVNTMWNINQGSAFFPEHLVSTTDEKPITVDIARHTEKIDDQSKENKVFDQLLGGFALMRLGGESYMNYSPNYFSTLSVINEFIRRELNTITAKNRERIFFKKFPFDESVSKYKMFIDLYDDTSKVKLRNSFYAQIDNEAVEKSAKEESLTFQKKLGKFVLESIDSEKKTYLYAILASYGASQARLSLDNFISDLIRDKKFPKARKEGISLIFGINKGYKAFRNFYQTENFKAIVKFEMNSLIDYHTIESVYQYVFNKKIVDELSSFEFETLIEKEKNKADNKKYLSYNILDKDIVYAKKPNTMKELLEILKTKLFFSEIGKPLVENFSTIHNIELTEDQQKDKLNEYTKIIEKPIKGMMDELESELSEYFQDLAKSKEMELEMLKQQRVEFFKTLKKLNEKLYMQCFKDEHAEFSNDALESFLIEFCKNREVTKDNKENNSN